jgi:hypothetical protein
MDGADDYVATFLGAGSSILDGLLGRWTASGVDDSLVRNEKFNDTANGVVGIRGGATLANNLPQIAPGEVPVCSKVRIVESSNSQFDGSDEELRFFEQMGPSVKSATQEGAGHGTTEIFSEPETSRGGASWGVR